MRDRTLISTVALLLLGGLLAAAGCAGTGGNGVTSDIPPTDVKGKKFLDGRLELSDMHWPEEADREGRFTLANVSEDDLKLLNVQIVYYFETPKEAVEKFGSEKAEQSVSVYRGQQIVVAATPKTDREIRSINITVEFMKRVATAARTWDAGDPPRVVPGTTFLDGRLECVEIQNALTGTPPAIRYRILNLTSAAIEDVRYSVVLVRLRDGQVTETRWLPTDGFGPGQEQWIEPDLTDLEPDFYVAILLFRQQI